MAYHTSDEHFSLFFVNKEKFLAFILNFVELFMLKMASNLQQLKLNYSDCFNIGSVVSCRTCFQKEIEGEVLAFDSQTKILILSILCIILH